MENTNNPEQATQPQGDPKETEAKVQAWLNKIEQSERYREKISRLYQWKEITEDYKGFQEQSLQDSDIYVPPLNYVFAYVKTEIPALMLRDPKIKVNAKQKTSLASAQILEKAVNYYWRHKRIKRQNKKNILDSKLVGHSWFKTGYTGNFKTIENGDKVFEFIEDEDFFGYRVPYNTITFNTDAMDPPYDCTWIAQEVWKPIEFLQDAANGYENTSGLTPSSEPVATDDNTTDKSGGDKTDRAKPDAGSRLVKIYEVWDKVGQEYFVVCPQVKDGFLRSPKAWPYTMRGFPFSYLALNENPDSAYPMPDVFMFRSQIYEKMKIRAMELDHLKRFNRQLITRKNALSDDSKEQFTQGITGAVIEADIQANESLTNVINVIPYAPIPSDAYAVEDRIDSDVINISGQSPQERGATQKTTTRTFRELAQIDRGAKNRRGDQQDIVEDFIEDIAYNLVALLKQFCDVPRYVAITGDEAQEIMQALQSRPSAGMEGAITSSQGFTFTKEDIQGEFDIEVVAGSTAPMDHDNRMATIMDVLQVSQQLGLMPGGPVAAGLGNWFAKELDMPELEKAIEEEAALKAQQMQEAKQEQQKQEAVGAAQKAAEMQLEAEKQATNQNKVAVDLYAMMLELKQMMKKEARDEGRDTV